MALAWRDPLAVDLEHEVAHAQQPVLCCGPSQPGDQIHLTSGRCAQPDDDPKATRAAPCNDSQVWLDPRQTLLDLGQTTVRRARGAGRQKRGQQDRESAANHAGGPGDPERDAEGPPPTRRGEVGHGRWYRAMRWRIPDSQFPQRKPQSPPQKAVLSGPSSSSHALKLKYLGISGHRGNCPAPPLNARKF